VHFAYNIIAVFSLFISITDERVSQTDRALAGMIAHYLCSEVCLILVHFM